MIVIAIFRMGDVCIKCMEGIDGIDWLGLTSSSELSDPVSCLMVLDACTEYLSSVYHCNGENLHV